MPYLTINETALILGKHPFTIRRWVKKGKLKHEREELYSRVKIPQFEVQELLLKIEPNKNLGV